MKDSLNFVLVEKVYIFVFWWFFGVKVDLLPVPLLKNMSNKGRRNVGILPKIDFW